MKQICQCSRQKSSEFLFDNLRTRVTLRNVGDEKMNRLAQGIAESLRLFGTLLRNKLPYW
jgi:hypothetical protein